MDGPWLTVVMPAYNEEAGLTRSVTLLASHLQSEQVRAEILIVDDCSTDRTGQLARDLVERYAEDQMVTIRVCRHEANRGIGGGLMTGVAEARGEWLILIPADLALDLSELSKYTNAAPAADFVVGIRSDRRDYTVFRRVVSEVNIGLVRLLFHMEQRQFQYISMYRLTALRGIDIEYWRSAFFHAEILIKARDLGYRIVEVEVRYVPRTSGRASGARWKLIGRTGRDMIHYWTKWISQHPPGVPRMAKSVSQSPRAERAEMERHDGTS
jgi:glycosyltransferase involved in cell wall biosynthesis